eukprot:TRINITY_DN12328_c0_g1_i2.p2 TRINITY_DN12328_c0_g1~~TRINITY_DN12328_c0_g1_i2.p2  ORF type:complete len:177 (+),score=29.28 TRINITY_DN12328_c0_g1_i2:1416-1946(+)
MVIGAANSFVVAAERAAAAWRFDVLVDAEVYAEVEPLWSCRLRKVVRFAKLGSRPVALWEVLDERIRSGANDEWMYELASALRNPWDAYNEAVAQWCTATISGDVLPLENAMRASDGAAPGGAVAEALHAVCQAVQASAPAPVGDFSAAAFAGDPSPLQCRASPDEDQRPLAFSPA